MERNPQGKYTPEFRAEAVKLAQTGIGITAAAKRLSVPKTCSMPHKTGATKESLRHVPLTPKAIRTINKMRGFDPVLVFGLRSQTLDTLFRRYRDQAGISGVTFHDSRHMAATWLAQKINVLDLCKAFGWSNTKQALVYYNPTASDIAKRMSSR